MFIRDTFKVGIFSLIAGERCQLYADRHSLIVSFWSARARWIPLRPVYDDICNYCLISSSVYGPINRLTGLATVQIKHPLQGKFDKAQKQLSLQNHNACLIMQYNSNNSILERSR